MGISHLTLSSNNEIIHTPKNPDGAKNQTPFFKLLKKHPIT
jgi:hypothetical protein